MSDFDRKSPLGDLFNEARQSSTLSFSDGFSDRVLQGLAAVPADDISVALARQTRRVLPALIAASLALVAWNWKATHATADSPIAAALGLEPVPSASATSGSALANAEAFQ